MKVITTTLSNGLTVSNFNSPHKFNFVDGTILESVSSDIAKETMLKSEDIFVDRLTANNIPYKGVKKIFVMSEACKDRLEAIQDISSIDIIIVPLPVLLLANELDLNKGKLFTVFVVDRVNKTIAVDKFCQ